MKTLLIVVGVIFGVIVVLALATVCVVVYLTSDDHWENG